MSYANRPSRRAIPDITPNREPFAPSAYVENREAVRQKKRQDNNKKGVIRVAGR